MTEAIGLNRRNDTPIGGKPEFRANFDDVTWDVDEIPTWDGTKFAPGSSVGLLTAYGGLASSASAGYTADGSVIDDWDSTTPLAGSPKQTTPVIATGLITVVAAGVYQLNFSISVSNLTNNEEYLFQPVVDGTPLAFGAVINGSNNLSFQSTSFTLPAQIASGLEIGIGVTNGSSNTYDIVSASLSITRIG